MWGMLGGSFDPPHVGHTIAARAVEEACGLAGVVLIPAARPPHKECVAPFADRVAMTRLAAKGLFEVSDVEGLREGPSYTVDTLDALPRRDWALLVGADMLADLPRWHRAADLVARAAVFAFARPGFDLGPAVEAFRAAFDRPPDRLVEVPAVDASSSEFRRRLAAGEPAAGMVAPAVWAYLRDRRLYPEGG